MRIDSNQGATRGCPECNGTMELRLAQYECNSCGFTVEEIPEVNEPDNYDSASTIKRAKLIRNEDPTPKGSYDASAGPAMDDIEIDYDPIPWQKEKWLYFLVITVMTIFLNIYIMFWNEQMRFVYQGQILMNVGYQLLWLGLMAVTLFWEEIVTKWTCVAIHVLSLLVAFVATLIVTGPLYYKEIPGSELVKTLEGIEFWVSLSIYLAMITWFFKLMHLDITNFVRNRKK